MSPITAFAVLEDVAIDLQAAIDATPEYGTLRLGAGVYTAPTAAGWVISKPITIEGDGCPAPYQNIPNPEVADAPAAWTTGTVLHPYTSAATSDGGKNSCVFHIVGPVVNVTIRNLGIEHPYIPPTSYPVSAGTGDGIHIDATAGYVGFVTIENVTVRFMGRNSFYLHGSFSGDGNVVDQCRFINCKSINSRLHGWQAYRAYDTLYDTPLVVGNQQCGMYLESSWNQRIMHPLSNNNGRSFVTSGTGWTGLAQAWPYYDQAQIYLKSVNVFELEMPDLEAWSGTGVGAGWVAAKVPHAIGLDNASAGSVRHASTYNTGFGDGVEASTLIFMYPSCNDITIEDNRAGDISYALFAMDSSNIRGINVGRFWTFDSGYGAALTLTYIRNEVETAANANCGNIVWQCIGASDKPTLRSSIAGIRFPLVSSPAAITTPPVEGLIIYDATAHLFKYYNGTTWKIISGVT